MNHFLAAWSTFYTITGSSAAALTGLMFIVITLVAAQERLQSNMRDGVEAFSSPTVVHFCAALLVSGILAAPWHLLLHPAIMLGIAGLYGSVYALRVIVRLTRFSRQVVYVPEIDDWLWYALMPLVAYVAIFGSAVALSTAPVQSLFVVAAGTLMLIFIGIRNAWDTVTYIAANDKQTEQS